MKSLIRCTYLGTALALAGTGVAVLAADKLDEPLALAVYFPAGETELTEDAGALLDEAVELASSGSSARLIIVGYAADSADEAAAEFASVRASAVQAGLIERGISPDLITIIGTCDARAPDGAPADEASFIADRRTEIIIMPDDTRSS